MNSTEQLAGLHFIRPDWPAPARVQAAVTTRVGGFSRGAYGSLNLAGHVGDDAQAVRQNRALLKQALDLPAEPVWLQQVHGVEAIDAAQAPAGACADASYTDRPGVVCAVLSADCLPLFLCDTQGTRVALVHAGWRGLAAGVIENGVHALHTPPSQLLAWLGPAIGARAFEVGPEVRARFLDEDARAAQAFTPGRNDHWYADLCALARQRLQRLGVEQMYGGRFCTVRERDRFFSYRRDGECGRMASLIWLTG